MAKLGFKTTYPIRRGKIHTPKAIPWSYALKEIFSEEFGYVVDVLTAGYAPGRAKEESKHGNLSD